MVKREIWHPPTYEKSDIRSVHTILSYAAGQGDAPSPEDCKRLLDWIIHKAAGTYDEPFRAGQSDVRDYMLGRRSVGLALVKLMKLKPEVLTK